MHHRRARVENPKDRMTRSQLSRLVVHPGNDQAAGKRYPGKRGDEREDDGHAHDRPEKKLRNDILDPTPGDEKPGDETGNQNQSRDPALTFSFPG